MINPNRVRQALYTLLAHPEQLLPGTAADLSLAMRITDPMSMGVVYEILRQGVADRLTDVMGKDY